MIYRFKSFALAVVFFVTGVAAFADTSKYPKHVEPALIQPALRDSFFDALTNNQPLDVSQWEPEVDSKLKEFWLGNKPELSASISAIELTFESASSDPSQPKRSVQVTFAYEYSYREGEGLAVSTSRPVSYAGGVMLYSRGERNRRTWLRGGKKSGLIVAAPEIANQGLRGFLFCPLDLPPPPPPGKRGPSGLVDSGYRPVSMRLKAAGAIAGVLYGGLKPAIARAYIATSSGIPNEGFSFDESYAVNPQVDIAYKRPDWTPPIALRSDGKFLEAMSLQLELQYNSGYKRVTTFTESVEIAPVERDFSLTVGVLQRNLQIQGRSCWYGLRASQAKHEYSHEAFKVQ